MSTEVQHAESARQSGAIQWAGRNWIQLLAWLALIIFWIPTFVNYVVAWDSPDGYYSHGWLIPFMCLWTAWMLKDRVHKLSPNPSAWALGLLAFFLASAALFGIQSSLTMRGLMFPVSIAAFVAALYGWSYVRTFVFPIFYLYFMCPIPDFILLTLSAKIQLWSTTIATYMSKAILINAVQNGNFIQTDYCNIEVGQACSGFRMLVALTAFAVFLVYAVKGDLWRKILFVLISMPLAVLVNSLRVAILVAVGHYWDPNLVHKLHDYSGYLVLLVAFVLMYWLARLLGCREFRLTESS